MGAYIFDENTGTILVPCRWCGKRVTFKIDVEGLRKWQGGELIQAALPNLTLSQREMLLSNTCQECWEKYIAKVLEPPEETEPSEQIEKCLYPHMILDPNISMDEEVPNSLYILAMQNYKVGDKVRHFVSAPGTGHVDYIITKMDEAGVWAIMIENTVRELQPWEVR